MKGLLDLLLVRARDGVPPATPLSPRPRPPPGLLLLHGPRDAARSRRRVQQGAPVPRHPRERPARHVHLDDLRGEPVRDGFDLLLRGGQLVVRRLVARPHRRVHAQVLAGVEGEVGVHVVGVAARDSHRAVGVHRHVAQGLRRRPPPELHERGGLPGLDVDVHHLPAQALRPRAAQRGRAEEQRGGARAVLAQAVQLHERVVVQGGPGRRRVQALHRSRPAGGQEQGLGGLAEVRRVEVRVPRQRREGRQVALRDCDELGVVGVDAVLDPAHALLQGGGALRDAGHLLGEAGEQVVRRLQQGGQLADGAAQRAVEHGLQLIVLDEGLAVRARQLAPAHEHGLHRPQHERHGGRRLTPSTPLGNA